MRKILYLGPLILFVTIAIYFAAPILAGKDPRILPSAMIEKPIPNLDLPPLVRTKSGIDNQSLTGNVRLVNFFSCNQYDEWIGLGQFSLLFQMAVTRSFGLDRKIAY